jgi:hypothetical protein
LTLPWIEEKESVGKAESRKKKTRKLFEERKRCLLSILEL